MRELAHGGGKCKIWGQTDWIYILDSLLMCSVTLSNSLNLSESQLLNLETKDNTTTSQSYNEDK